jgi:hypothetical protein
MKQVNEFIRQWLLLQTDTLAQQNAFQHWVA